MSSMTYFLITACGSLLCHSDCGILSSMQEADDDLRAQTPFGKIFSMLDLLVEGCFKGERLAELQEDISSCSSASLSPLKQPPTSESQAILRALLPLA